MNNINNASPQSNPVGELPTSPPASKEKLTKAGRLSAPFFRSFVHNVYYDSNLSPKIFEFAPCETQAFTSFLDEKLRNEWRKKIGNNSYGKNSNVPSVAYSILAMIQASGRIHSLKEQVFVMKGGALMQAPEILELSMRDWRIFDMFYKTDKEALRKYPCWVEPFWGSNLNYSCLEIVLKQCSDSQIKQIFKKMDDRKVGLLLLRMAGGRENVGLSSSFDFTNRLVSLWGVENFTYFAMRYSKDADNVDLISSPFFEEKISKDSSFYLGLIVSAFKCENKKVLSKLLKPECLNILTLDDLTTAIMKMFPEFFEINEENRLSMLIHLEKLLEHPRFIDIDDKAYSALLSLVASPSAASEMRFIDKLLNHPRTERIKSSEVWQRIKDISDSRCKVLDPVFPSGEQIFERCRKYTKAAEISFKILIALQAIVLTGCLVWKTYNTLIHNRDK